MSKKITVRNRSNSFIGYEVPDMNLKRDFAPYEEKSDITEEEIQKLSYGIYDINSIKSALLQSIIFAVQFS